MSAETNGIDLDQKATLSEWSRYANALSWHPHLTPSIHTRH
ncbi:MULTISPECIES: hypothetical protein [unclassified Moorena]|nr:MULTISPECIES: hypothetical protein [unclassified Moorena]